MSGRLSGGFCLTPVCNVVVIIALCLLGGTDGVIGDSMIWLMQVAVLKKSCC